MTHPTTAPGGWTLEYVVYPGSPGEIAVGVLQRELKSKAGTPIVERMMGLRWCEGDGRASSRQEGAQDWFVLPFTFSAAITRSLLQMKATGFSGFDEPGIQKLIGWMSDYDHQAIDDALVY